MSWIDDLRNIIGKPGGTVLAAGKSLIDAIGHNGTAAQGTGIDGKLGSPVSTVSADVAAVKGETATIVADTNELQADWTDGGRLDLILDDVAGAVGAGAGTTGVADGGSVNTMVDAALTQAESYWVGAVLVMITGNNAGLARVITEFLSASDTIGVRPDFPGIIAASDEYTILPRDQWASILIGSSDANNLADTSTVVANVDGSVLERIEGLQGTAFDPTTDSLVKIHDDHVTEISATRMQELDAANLPSDIDGIKAVTDALPNAGALTTIDTNIDDIETDTNDMTTNGVKLNAQGKLDVNAEVDTALDTAVPGSPTSDSINERIKAIDDLTQETGAGDLGAILANTIDVETDTNELQTDWTNGGRLDSILDDVAGAVGSGTQTTGTADGGSIGTLDDAVRTEADSYWNGQTLIMTSGNNNGLARTIVKFAAALDRIYVEPNFPNAIAVGDTYVILARAQFASVMIGNDNPNNEADTGFVAANVDGSVLERLEALQGVAFDPATESLVKIHDDHVTEISAVRMQELDAANLPSDVDAILLDTGTTLPTAITTTEGNIRGTDNDTIKTISDQIDALDIGVVQAAQGISDTATTTENECIIVNHATPGHVYRLFNLRVKCVDPGVNTVTVKLYEEINTVLTNIDSFVIDTNNYTTYYSLMDMFGVNSISGASIKITCTASAGTYAITGQELYADVTLG